MSAEIQPKKIRLAENSAAIFTQPAKFSKKFGRGVYPNGASNAGGVGRNRDSEPVSGFSACC